MGSSPSPLRTEPSEPPERRYRYWTAEEDRALLAYEPGKGLSLRDVALSLNRTYYACRARRKELLANRIQPGGRYSCVLCFEPLPEGQKRGYCPSCRRRRGTRVRKQGSAPVGTT